MSDPDPMAPPADPCECFCLHCRRTFMSTDIWFQRIIGDPAGFTGFWMCPTPNCSGAGFAFDLFPTDPDHPANEGWSDSDDEEFYEDDEEINPVDSEDPEESEYDPTEPAYASMDAAQGDPADDILEGDEWKRSPDAPPSHPQDDEEARYDQPDQRPRTIDWSDRTDRARPFIDGDEDDLPF